jgi:hypothetical protein
MQVKVADKGAYRATLSPINRGVDKNCMPKVRADLQITLNGQPYTAKVTGNRGWSGSGDQWLEYIWFVAPDGKAYYITLDYAEAASTWAGAEFTTADGIAERVDPKRVTAGEATKREAERVTKFKTTFAANRAV